MTIGLPPISMRSRLCRCHDKTPRFNGARPKQYMPMRLAADRGKGGRNQQQLGTIKRQLAIKMRKPHIIADAEADWHIANHGKDRR